MNLIKTVCRLDPTTTPKRVVLNDSQTEILLLSRLPRLIQTIDKDLREASGASQASRIAKVKQLSRVLGILPVPLPDGQEDEREDAAPAPAPAPAQPQVPTCRPEQLLGAANVRVFGDPKPVRRRVAPVDPVIDPRGMVTPSEYQSSMHFFAVGQIRWGITGNHNLTRMRIAPTPVNITSFGSRRRAHHATSATTMCERRDLSEHIVRGLLKCCIDQYPDFCEPVGSDADNDTAAARIAESVDAGATLLRGATAAEICLIVDLAREATLLARHARCYPSAICSSKDFPLSGTHALLRWALQTTGSIQQYEVIQPLRDSAQKLPATGGVRDLETLFRVRCAFLQQRLDVYRTRHNSAYRTEIARRRDRGAISVL